MKFRLSLFVNGFFLIFALSLLPGACGGPAKEGEFCKKNGDCEEELSCLNNRCIKRKTYRDSGPSEQGDEPKAEPSDPPDDSREPTKDESKAQDDPAKPEPRPDASPQDRGTPPEPRPQDRTAPDASTPDQVATSLSIYDMLTPGSAKTPKDGATVTVTGAVVTTPLVRLSGDLNTFFVQAEQKNQGSFKYGGLQVIYKRADHASLNLSIGTIVELKGKFSMYRSVYWTKTCSADSECSNPQQPKCLEVFNTRTNQNEKHCASAIAMPQIELSAAPQSRGNAPAPAPVVVNPADIRSSPTAEPYLGVLVQVKDVVVTNANPDAPKDYSEFSVADPNDKSNDIRVDDLFNTILYTGSKFCGGCTSKPKKPDDSYCLPGDKCNCKGSSGRCHSGTEQQDIRTLNDKFAVIIGVLRYANGDFKLQPRLPTDMK